MYNAKYLLIFAIFGILSSISRSISQNLELINDFNVGVQPLAVVYLQNANTFAIFCNGNDKNFDGMYENGDEKATIWTIDVSSQTGAEKVADLDDFFKFPLRIGIDTTYDDLFVPSSNGLDFFSSNLNMVDTNIAACQPEAVYQLDSNRLLLLNQPPDFTAKGSVWLWDKNTATKLSELQTGESPIDAVSYCNNGTGNPNRIAVLCEGVFGSPSSTLQIAAIDGDSLIETVVIYVGDTGNKMALAYPFLYIVMNGSNEIKKVDLSLKKVVDSVSTGTTGFAGPREIAISGNYAYVTTYNSDLRVLDLSSFKFIGTYDLPGNAEGLSIGPDNTLLVTIPGSYDKLMSIIRAYKIKSTYVNDNLSLSSFSVYPNPCRDFIKFTNNSVNSLRCEIFDSEGQSVTKFDSQANEITKLNINNFRLSSGIYYISINYGKRIQILPFLIQN